MLDYLKTLYRRATGQQEARTWHGRFLSPDEIAADMVARIRKDPVALQRWLDPWSWEHPLRGLQMSAPDGLPWREKPDQQAVPDHCGCLFDAGRAVRNWYGLWRSGNPYTKTGDDVELTDGIITDPRHPDNLSADIIVRVLNTLKQENAHAATR